MDFKLQHPADIISRLFILQYMRKLDNKYLYEKANQAQKLNLFYKFTSDEDPNIEEIDINWEYALFKATLPELEFFMKQFLAEIKEIDKTDKEELEKQAADLQAQQIAEPVDINIMDLANTEMRKNNGLQI